VALPLLLWVPPAQSSTAAQWPPAVQTLAQDIHHGAQELARGTRESLQFARVDGGDALVVEPGRAIGTYLSPIVETDLAFTHAGLHWLARYHEGTTIRFEVRTSVDGLGWSPWRQVYIEAEAGQAARDETYGALISEKLGRYLQYRATFQAVQGRSPALLYVTITAINTLDGPRLERPAPAPSLASLFMPAATSAQVAKPINLTREQWGADETLRFSNGREIWPRMYVPTKKIVVHHTATSNDYTNGAVEVRAIYYYHAVTLGWGDIGYNALVDRFGNSYEGRYGREGSSFDDPILHREILSEDVVAGHAYYHNYGSTGIALLGNFEEVTPSDEALAKLQEILVFECGYHGIDPKGASDFLRSDDFWNRSLSNICGHRDCTSTACPGQYLYSQLPTLRDQVAAVLANPSAPTVTITEGPDGVTVVGGKATYRWSGTTGSTYSFYLEGWALDKRTGSVKYLSGFTAEKAPVWGDWTNDTSKTFQNLSAGHYTFHVMVKNSQGVISAYQANRTFLAKGSAKK